MNPRLNPDTAAGQPGPPGARDLRGPLLDALLTVATGVVVIAVDHDLRILFVSGTPTLGRHGHAPSDMVGRQVHELVPGALVVDQLLPLYGSALDGAYGDADIPAADGSALYRVQSGPLSRDGRIIGAVTISRDVTYERQVERRFHTVMASSTDGIIGIDASGNIVSVNDALCALSGRTELELLGASVDLLVPDAVRGRHGHLRDTFAQAPRQRPMAAGVDLALQHKDGSVVPVEIGLSPSSGGDATVMATVRDLTARRHADEELREARERFARAFEEAPIGMAIVGLDGRFLQVNQSMCRIVGRPAEGLLAGDFQSVTHPDDLQTDEAQLAQLLDGTRERFQLDKRYLLPDGTPVPVSLHVSVLRHPDGSPASFIAQVVDLSERLRTQQALSDERDFLAALLESLDAGVVACDGDGCLTLFNAAAAEMHGAAAEPLHRQAWPSRYRLHHADGRPMSPDEVPLARALDGEHVRDAELLVEGEDGAPTLLSVNAQTIRSADGRPLGAVAVQQDITSRRRLEDALRSAELLWRDAFEHGPVGMAIVEIGHGDAGDCLLRSANRALCDLLGEPLRGFEGRSCTELAFGPEDAGRVAGLLAAVAAQPAGRQDAEVRLRHHEGHSVWAHLTVTATPGPGEGTLAIVHLYDVSERKSYEARLEHLADHDPLTGYFNRRRFDEELERSVALARRHGRPGALLLVDLDQFKYVNDTYGHLAGDEVIRRVGAVLQDRLRSTDILGRIGGDEFAVILAETGQEEAQTVARQLLEALRATPAKMSTGQTLVLTASIGVASIDAPWKLTPGELLVEADIAMYDAKDAGRNQIAVASAGRHTHAKMKARLTWAERIRRALDDERFVLHGQPIVRVDTGAIDRHELLIRMRDDRDELVVPGRFLPIAERFGQIQEIDQWVMRQAVTMLSGDGQLRLSINLSGASIGDAHTVGQLSDLVSGSGIDPSRLMVEITETAAIRSIDAARGFAQQLADLGCLLALDDFGAGFGSFFYLKHLPFDCLKIDGEFIRGMASSRSDRLTVEAIVKIAKGLGKRTTAEYVADEETLEAVRELGVDFAQGYLLGRPAPLLPPPPAG